MLVREIMTEDPITANPTTTVREVMELMYAQDVRHLPIVDGDRLLGIISERDLRSLSMPVTSVLSDPQSASKRLEEPISSIMRGDVISVETESTVDELIDTMIETKIGAVPVVDAGTETLVGIASYIDVLAAARSALES